MEGDKKSINQALWLECAGPLITLPAIGSQVVYFPQGHSEQVIASTQKEADADIPSYPNLPPQLFCQLHNITLHADQENDEVFAQMTLQPLQQNTQLKDPLLLPDLGIQPKQAIISFSKTLTASDTSTHGGFSIPRRAAEKVFPPLDFNKTPPAQELVARDLHNTDWHFRHIYRGQPRRHLLTTGWSVFVSAKRLQAGDTVLFLRDEQGQLMLGIRRANRQQANLPTSLLSSDSMLIGVLAAAAHAAATNSRFTIFYNPRASPSEFVIPLAKYQKALHPPQLTVGMRFRMEMETEDSSTRRYMGTITGIGDLDSVRWPNSAWRSLKVGWDESAAGQRQRRVSAWEIEPLTAPFLLCNSSFLLRSKRLRPNEEEMDLKRPPAIWARGEEGKFGMMNASYGGSAMEQWLRLQQKQDGSMQPAYYNTMAAVALQEMRNTDSKQITTSSLNSFQSLNQFGGIQQHSSPAAMLQVAPSAQVQTPYLKGGAAETDLSRSFSLRSMMSNRQGSEGATAAVSAVVDDNATTYSSMLHHGSASCSFSQQQRQQHQHQHQQQGVVIHEPPTASGNWMEQRDHHAESVTLPPLARLDHHHGQQMTTCTSDSALPPQQQQQQQHQQHLLYRNNQEQQDAAADPRAAANFLFGVNIEGRLGGIPTSVAAAAAAAAAAPQQDASMALNSVPALSNNGVLVNGEDISWQQSSYPPPIRTFTKVHKVGSVGRSLDMTRFKNYNDLRNELAKMFGLEGQLDNNKSGWQVVFIDNENDMLLLGDDPWEEFISCVKSIRILSPSEVLQMRQEQLDWLNSIPLQQQQQQRQTSSSSEECVARPENPVHVEQQQQQQQQVKNNSSNSNGVVTAATVHMRNPVTLSSNYSDPSCISEAV